MTSRIVYGPAQCGKPQQLNCKNTLRGSDCIAVFANNRLKRFSRRQQPKADLSDSAEDQYAGIPSCTNIARTIAQNVASKFNAGCTRLCKGTIAEIEVRA